MGSCTKDNHKLQRNALAGSLRQWSLHKGWVIVSLNAGSDTYEIRLFGPDNETVVKLVKGVFCDNLGAMIDELVERPADITDEQYTELIIQSEGA